MTQDSILLMCTSQLKPAAPLSCLPGRRGVCTQQARQSAEVTWDAEVAGLGRVVLLLQQGRAVCAVTEGGLLEPGVLRKKFAVRGMPN